MLAELESGGKVSPPFHRPMALDSEVSGNVAKGHVLAVVNRPLRDIEAALADPARWCAVMVLHINNRGCTGIASAAGSRVDLKVVRRHDHALDQAFELDFAFRVSAATPDHFAVRLDAPAGPMGTSDYQIRLEAWAASESASVVRLSYSYRQSSLTAWAVSLYLSTFGKGKVGFSATSTAADGSPHYVGGIRGVVERNLMRYFLAVEVAAAQPTVATEAAYRQRLIAWFDASERYARQLHELDRETYLSLKLPLRSIGVVDRS